MKLEDKSNLAFEKWLKKTWGAKEGKLMYKESFTDINANSWLLRRGFKVGFLIAKKADKYYESIKTNSGG